MCGVSLRERKMNAELSKTGMGRPRMTWVKAVESDMRVKGLMRKDVEDQTKWRAMSWGAKG